MYRVTLLVAFGLGEVKSIPRCVCPLFMNSYIHESYMYESCIHVRGSIWLTGGSRRWLRCHKGRVSALQDAGSVEGSFYEGTPVVGVGFQARVYAQLYNYPNY